MSDQTYGFVSGSWTSVTPSCGTVYQPQASTQEWVSTTNGTSYYNTGYTSSYTYNPTTNTSSN